MLEILERIVGGKGTMEDLDLLDELSQTITDTALCGLGKRTAQLVMSTMKFFREEYEQHVKEKRGRFMNCEAPRKFVIDPQKCKGCSEVRKEPNWPEPSRAR